MDQTEVVVISAARTAIGRGRPGGAWSGRHPVDLLGSLMAEVTGRADIDAALIEDVIVGCVSQGAEQSFNIARNAVLAAGFPVTVPGTTVDRQCGSSLQAVQFAAQALRSGDGSVMMAGGVEMMGTVEMFSTTMGGDPYGPALRSRFRDLVPQGISAELVAARWKISRSEADQFAARSQHLAAHAQKLGAFEAEIVPLPAADGHAVTLDEGIRPDTTPGVLARLKPAFYSDRYAELFPEINWIVHAGNSSQISDGAAAVLLTTRNEATRLGLPVRARLTGFAVAGSDPVEMLTGVIPATTKALDRRRMVIGDIDLFEINEAFAPVVLAWQQETAADMERVNVNGGAIALGHPLGATGARLITTMIHALETQDKEVGLVAVCEGGGMANACIVERL